MANAASPANQIDHLSELFCGGQLPTIVRTALLEAVGNAMTDQDRLAILTAGMLASPTFQWR